ncbi:prepilin-type N-terminal cleavage/methylation domain-containing protein [Microbacterium sp. cf046]|uniref:type IV pilus modification PilV family protein n=1 Tax=Microbacterium sp. cf046 TaxID=1761803 RepID=UPI0015870B1C|nr:prepilin-type N-terminal cleavage/methylation domain-containing protein [Microbacterium sp. cf046]
MSRSDREAGVSLIELIVYVLVSSILLLAMSSILINSWTTQRNVTSVSDATNRGQVISSTIERAMRNALAFDVSADGTTLRVRTSLNGILACQGFVLTPGQSRMSLSSSTLTDNSTWAEWQPGVVPRGSVPFFSVTASTVMYTFDIQTSSTPVRFGGQAFARSSATGVTTPCW